MPRQRDYKTEYQRRIANAAKRGLSRSQARGHARAGEPSVRRAAARRDDRLEAALERLRKTNNQARAAREAGVSAERFRRFLRDNSLAERRGRHWQITDNRPHEMTVISGGRELRAIFNSAEQMSLNGEHLNAVQSFLRTNDIDVLGPFEGRAVIDSKGKAHPLETNPNALYRLAHAGGEVFHEVYRLIL